MTKILSIGTGKDFEEFNNLHSSTVNKIVHVDKLYEQIQYCSQYDGSLDKNFKLIGKDIFQYLEEHPFKEFNSIYAQRVFEHIPVDKIHYLLYLLYSVSKQNTKLFIIVPNFLKVFEKIKEIEPLLQNGISFTKDLIDVTTELFNEPSDPHRSIWTDNLLKYYIETENYWTINQVCDNITLDNRNWYMEIVATKN